MSFTSIPKIKTKNLTKEELLELTKEELVERILQLEAHNLQLKNIINKKNAEEDGTKHFKNQKRSIDFSKYGNRRILIRISYLGVKYHGLATQEDTTSTIEHHLFHALTKSQLIPSRDKANYHRCGRTDKGVSSSGQVISLIVRSKLTDEELSSEDGGRYKEFPYCRILNRLLPNDIRAISWMPLPMESNEEAFSARFNCTYRTYKYWFVKSFLNIAAMREACKYLEGSHDFRNFCKMDVANGVTSFIRHIYGASIVPENPEGQHNEYARYYLKITANAFLWHQIRCIAGVLILIGNNQEKPDIIKNLLDIDNHPRKPQYNMAAELPLNLFKCTYTNIDEDIEYEIYDKEKLNPALKKDWWVIDRDDLINVMRTLHEHWTNFAIQEAMVKDIIDDLARLYAEDEKRSIESRLESIDLYKKILRNDILIPGVKPKNYTPLLKRATCEPLESRIEHFVKKKKLKETEEKQD